MPTPSTTRTRLTFPWPTLGEERGPCVRMVARDVVWVAAVKRCFGRWRSANSQTLPVYEFEQIDQLGTSTTANSMLDLVEVSRNELSSVAEWIASGGRPTCIALLLCRQTLRDPADRTAAERLLREARPTAVLSSPQDLRSLAELCTWIATSGASKSSSGGNSLAELPLPCWGTPWQSGR